MGVIITFLLVGGIMGFGCAALYYQRQIDQIASLKMTIRQNNAATYAAEQIIESQKAQIGLQQMTIEYAKREIRSLSMRGGRP